MNSDDQKYETGKYIGDSFRDLTRIANINEDLWDELFMNNKQYLLASIERFEEQLDVLKNAIRDNDDETLKVAFRKSTKKEENICKNVLFFYCESLIYKTKSLKKRLKDYHKRV